MARKSVASKAVPNAPGIREVLLSFVERIARLEDEKAEIAGNIKDVKAEAASNGFDRKMVTAMVAEYRMDESERMALREFEALREIYRGTLGMLDGTPLGENARKKLAAPPPPDDDDGDGNEGDAGEAPEPMPEEPNEPEFPPEDLEAARERARQDVATGRKITDNPYTSGDPRRSVWDEEWCAASGSDGMDIPSAYRRTTPKKPPKDDGAAPAKKAA